MARLTTFSKFLITLVILAALFFLGRYLLNNTEFGRNLKQKSAETGTDTGQTGKAVKGDDDVLKVQLFTWGGYAPGLYYNNGSEPNTESRYYKDYGLKVKFILMDDFNATREAWKADQVHLIGQTADALPTEMEAYAQYQPTAIMQVDWSRGGDAIVVRRGINSVNDLKGKKVAVTPSTPSQTLLITLLDAAGMSLRDITIVPSNDNPQAAQIFRSGEADAAVVWSPDDIFLTRDVPGSKVLESTRGASNVIADIFYGKKSFIDANRDKINKFYEGWMKGAAEINSDDVAKNRAAEVMAKVMNLSKEDALGAIDNTRLCTHGDNRNFFGLNNNYRGVTGDMIYSKMAKRFAELGFAGKNLPPWRNVAYSGGVQSANLQGSEHDAEPSKQFEAPTPADRTRKAVASKPITINFPTGSSTLSENAKTIIDLQFGDVIKSFANARVRIEGNTDNVGNRNMNMALSRKRAEAVANYLRREYDLNMNKFIIVGNGPDKPVPGCERNQNAACKAKNRRTDFQLITQ